MTLWFTAHMLVVMVVAVLGQASPMEPKAPGRLTVNEQPAQKPETAPDDDDWAGTKPAVKPRARVAAIPHAPAQEHWSASATKRFVGAFLGGAVGAALALVPGTIATNGCPTLLAPCPGWAATGAVAAPILAVIGAAVGYSLMGGEPSVGAALAGMIGGLAGAAVLLLVDALISFGPSSGPRVPIAIAASGLAISLSVLAMESRSEALERAPFITSPASRITLTALALVGSLAIEALLVGFFATGAGGNAVLAVGLTVASLAATPFIPVAVHRAMGGRGSFAAAYLGWLATLGVAAIAVTGITAGASSLLGGDPRFVRLFAISITGGSLAAALGVPLFLEWSHGNALLEEAEKEPTVKAQLSLAPVTGPTGLTGGGLALSGTF